MAGLCSDKSFVTGGTGKTRFDKAAYFRQAARIPGVSPADIAILMVYLRGGGTNKG